jgi:L-lysine 2,3-aminomutase/predicted Fe-Mo cluster-binding NifX family protein
LTDLRVASVVLPFRVNDYVLDELIDWNGIPSDPIFQLTFPQAEMLKRADYLQLRNLLTAGADPEKIKRCARKIQMRMNPHPAGQMELNVPAVGGRALLGCQHKYRETVLFFPPAGQTCHAFCTYCFRWPQFVGIEDLRIALHEIDLLVRYLRDRTEVTDVLVTGGDPLFMKTAVLRRNIEPLLGDALDHISTIRIGTKALSHWPYRFTTDDDAEDLLRLFEQVRQSGRQLALMAHFSHPRELQTAAVREALRRLRDSGVVVRCQAPLIRHINDSPSVWAEMWREQLRLGAIPYYLFVARNTGPRSYFEIPLARAFEIYSDAFARVSGLGRTVRGPIMSAAPGKVLVDGITTINGQKTFVLKMIQGRDPTWANRVLFARFDPDATWLDQLQPAFGESEFFFESALREMADHAGHLGFAARGFANRAERVSSDFHKRAFCIPASNEPRHSPPPMPVLKGRLSASSLRLIGREVAAGRERAVGDRHDERSDTLDPPAVSFCLRSDTTDRKGGDSMKIAISATGTSPDAPMDDRFGRCPCFVITDAEGSFYDGVTNVHAERGSGAGIQAACLLIERGVSVVLTGRCGPNASETLSAAGVGIVTGCHGTVRQAVEGFAANPDGATGTTDSLPGPGQFSPEPGRGMGQGGGRGMGGGSGQGRRRGTGGAKAPRS